MNNVVIAIENFGLISDKPLQILERAGLRIIVDENFSKIKCKENDISMENVNYIIAGVESYDSNFLQHTGQLRCISRVGVGVDNIDLKQLLRWV